jgi:serine/threonine-protein kinase
MSAVAEDVRRFADYLLVERLGVGGTASVYLGKKRLHDGFEWVALKCLHPHLIGIDEVVRMFLVEAELLSRLHHRNVCEILRYGTESGVPFIATRYLRGGTLDVLFKKLRDRSRPPDLMAWIVAEACAGLHHAHEARDEAGAHLGLVHRDISPQNIFVTFNGEVRLLDFGIARAAIKTGFTTTGEVKGKDGYMSPEQVNSGSLDRRSDIFSMGVVLWEMLTGARLFERPNQLATALAITEAPSPDPRTIDPSIPEAYADIALRALQLEAEDRFSTAHDMEAALRSGMSDDLSPDIQLQILLRSLLATEDDPDTDRNLERKALSNDTFDEDPFRDGEKTIGADPWNDEATQHVLPNHGSFDTDSSDLTVIPDEQTDIGDRPRTPLIDLEEGAGDSTAKIPAIVFRGGGDTLGIDAPLRSDLRDDVIVQAVDDRTAEVKKRTWPIAILVVGLITLAAAVAFLALRVTRG